ncbi:hypothetical protein C8R44DRAFT_769831 [Mycena epipterygia]|nr:hypothetical protein C8R44DRAFT_769831 [Mycena epipterygia]
MPVPAAAAVVVAAADVAAAAAAVVGAAAAAAGGPDLSGLQAQCRQTCRRGSRARSPDLRQTRTTRAGSRPPGEKRSQRWSRSRMNCESSCGGIRM